MKILITNDDGIYAEGIRALVEWAKRYGEVTVVAPKTEQSGKSHAIEFVNPVEIKRVDIFEGVEAYRMDSTPADCVRFANSGLGRKFDLVLSGINRGVNVGIDVIYSGTVAAIFEAAYWKTNAIAVSTYPDTLDCAVKYMDEVYAFICKNNLFEANGIYNVNIPKDAKGIKITKMGTPYFDDSFRLVDKENDMWLQCGTMIDDSEPEDETRDTVALKRGYIALSPMTIDRVDREAYAKISTLSEEL
jgi:5'-nucleotidase